MKPYYLLHTKYLDKRAYEKTKKQTILLDLFFWYE